MTSHLFHALTVKHMSKLEASRDIPCGIFTSVERTQDALDKVLARQGVFSVLPEQFEVTWTAWPSVVLSPDQSTSSVPPMWYKAHKTILRGTHTPGSSSLDKDNVLNGQHVCYKLAPLDDWLSNKFKVSLNDHHQSDTIFMQFFLAFYNDQAPDIEAEYAYMDRNLLTTGDHLRSVLKGAYDSRQVARASRIVSVQLNDAWSVLKAYLDLVNECSMLTLETLPSTPFEDLVIFDRHEEVEDEEPLHKHVLHSVIVEYHKPTSSDLSAIFDVFVVGFFDKFTLAQQVFVQTCDAINTDLGNKMVPPGDGVVKWIAWPADESAADGNYEFLGECKFVAKTRVEMYSEAFMRMLDTLCELKGASDAYDTLYEAADELDHVVRHNATFGVSDKVTDTLIHVIQNAIEDLKTSCSSVIIDHLYLDLLNVAQQLFDAIDNPIVPDGSRHSFERRTEMKIFHADAESAHQTISKYFKQDLSLDASQTDDDARTVFAAEQTFMYKTDNTVKTVAAASTEFLDVVEYAQGYDYHDRVVKATCVVKEYDINHPYGLNSVKQPAVYNLPAYIRE